MACVRGSNWQNTIWCDKDALAYSRAMDISDYVTQVAPCVVSLAMPALSNNSLASVFQNSPNLCRWKPVQSLLDVGAGDGRFALALTRPGGQVDAVEPSPLMRRLLRQRLQGRRVRTWAQPWWRLPDKSNYELGFAANMVAFSSDPLGLFHRMRSKCQRMVWVVPAQNAPASFCLSGLVAKWLPHQSSKPRYKTVLEKLGKRRFPHTIELRDWTYRRQYKDVAAAVASLQSSLDQVNASFQQAELFDLVSEHGVINKAGRVTLETAKRSAVMHWT